MPVWRDIKRFFTAREIRQVYVRLRSRYALSIHLKLDRDGEKYVILKMMESELAQESCSMDIEEFGAFADAVSAIRSEIEKPSASDQPPTRSE